MCGAFASSSVRAADAGDQGRDHAVVLAAAAHDISAGRALRVVAFGSSSTEGVGATSPDKTYPARLQADLAAALPRVNLTVLNRGIGGQDAEDFDARLTKIIDDKPDVVIFQTGTNDPLRKLPLERFKELTRRDVARLRAAGIDVIMMEPQFCRVFAEQPGAFDYVTAVREIGASFGLPVIRRWDMMHDWLARHVAPPDQLQAPDGLHMANVGYRLLAQEVTRVILADTGTPIVQAAR